MDLTGYTDDQIVQMVKVANMLFADNISKVDMCIKTLRSLDFSEQPYKQSLPYKRMQLSLTATLNSQRVLPEFSHTIQGLVFEEIQRIAEKSNSYQEYVDELQNDALKYLKEFETYIESLKNNFPNNN